MADPGVNQGQIKMSAYWDTLLNIENGIKGKVPVYTIGIDGTAIESSFKKFADDISELNIKHGLSDYGDYE